MHVSILVLCIYLCIFVYMYHVCIYLGMFVTYNVLAAFELEKMHTRTHACMHVGTHV